jgi:hypothetical protein
MGISTSMSFFFISVIITLIIIVTIFIGFVLMIPMIFTTFVWITIL